MATATSEQFEFKTEIKELLHLITHTLYSHKEIFLRELLSNANDALGKVQFRSLTDQDLYDKDQALEITIRVDEKKRLLTVEDTGVGMTRQQLVEQIGTVAYSGTKRFMKELAEAKDKETSMPELIGQFGVGFYSVFMVADKVTIETKSVERDEPAVAWESDGTGSYTMTESARRKRGTAITLHLKKEDKEFVEPLRIKNLVKRYSNYLPFPVRMDDETINTPEALWRKAPSECKAEDYHEFYKSNFADWQDPMHVEHFSADAPVQFNAMLFTPKSAPHDYVPQRDDEHGLKLYVKRVFIQDNCNALVPTFLRFLKGVVETEDLPLNVSRETIQNNANIAKISKVITRKYLSALGKMAKKNDEAYLEFWRQFGRYIKEGVHGEANLRKKLLPLLRFYTSKTTDKPSVSLDQYVKNKREDQKAIYYAVGESVDQLRRSPHLELFLRNELEVLLMTEPIDDMLMTTLGEYDDLKLVNVESGDLELPDDVKQAVEDIDVSDELNKLKDKVREVLQDRIQNVRFTKAMSDSPCRFYNESGGMSHSVRKMMQEMNNMQGMPDMPLKRDLELNPEHRFVQALAQRLESDSIADQIRLLYHMANLLEGSVEDPQELAGLVLPLLR